MSELISRAVMVRLLNWQSAPGMVLIPEGPRFELPGRRLVYGGRSWGFDELGTLELRQDLGGMFLFLLLPGADLVFGQYAGQSWDEEQALALMRSLTLPFEHNLPGRARAGSLIGPEERDRAREASFSRARLVAGGVEVPLWEGPALVFDLAAQRVEGPCSLAFDQVTRFDLDYNCHEGDVKSHHLYFLALGNGTETWVFRERAKEYHNDMKASDDDCGAVQRKLTALPRLCGLPHRTSLHAWAGEPRAAFSPPANAPAPAPPVSPPRQGLLGRLLGWLDG